MKRFDYKARDQEGRLHSGVIEANDENQAARVLRERQLLITFLKPKGESFINEIRLGLLGRISFTDKVNFTRQLATMINSGLNLTNALRILQEQANPAFAKMVGEILNQVERRYVDWVSFKTGKSRTNIIREAVRKTILQDKKYNKYLSEEKV